MGEIGASPRRSPPTSDPDIRHRARVGALEAARFGEVVAAGLGLPAAFAPWVATMVAETRFSAYLAYAADQPVGAPKPSQAQHCPNIAAAGLNPRSWHGE
jgi:hypothetical protein